MKIKWYVPILAVAAFIFGTSTVASAEEPIEVSSEPTVACTTAIDTVMTAETVTSVITEKNVPEITDKPVTEATQPQLKGLVDAGDGRIFYYPENGEIIGGLTEIDGEYYYIAPNGAVKTGWNDINGIRMFFETESGRRKSGWIDYNGCHYYSDAEHGKLTGEQTIEGKIYIFDEQGKLCTGWIEYNGAKYYARKDGSVMTGDCEIEGIIYRFSPKGKYQSGWQTINGKRIYYDYDSVKPLYGWIRCNDILYYADKASGKYTGDRTINGDVYRFSEKGIIQTGMQKFSDGTRLYNNDGTIVKGFHTLNGNKYYFDGKGIMQTNIVEIEGNRYYFGKDGIMQTGLIELNGSKYYFGKNGKMQTGWQKINSQKYYFQNSGKMAVGLLDIGSDTYYFGKDGSMKTGWQTIKGKKYFFQSDGTLRRNMPKVFVGVGHGGYDSGAVKYIVEKEYTLKTGLLVAEYLTDAGMEVLMSRTADIDTTMEGKLKLCNDYDPDIIIDIHFNAGGGHGFEVYHSMYGGMSLKLAENINAEVSKFMSGRGPLTFIRDGKDRFTIIRETHAPAVLLEGGYVDDWSDAEFIKSNYMLLARAYADGVLKTIEELFF